MDADKRQQLIDAISARGYGDPNARVLVSCKEFFDGNDVANSIGWNLAEHPGSAAFASAFHEIESTPGVAGVFFAINSIDESNPETWPYADTAYVITVQPPEAFEDIVRPLSPASVMVSGERVTNPPEVPAGFHLVQIRWA